MAYMNKGQAIFLALLLLALPALAAYSAGFDALLPLLIDLPDWEAEQAAGSDATAEGVRAVVAFRSYQSGDRKFNVNILVGLQALLTWLPDYREGLRIITPDALTEVKNIEGFLVFYNYQWLNKSGGIIVLLRDGADDPDLGAVLAVDFEDLSLEEALTIAQRFDWAEMKEQIARLR
jgi:hypothetical protein